MTGMETTRDHRLLGDPMATTYILEIEWDRPTPDAPRLPSLVGPFATREHADDWAHKNIQNGSWEARPLASADLSMPFYLQLVGDDGVEWGRT